MRIPFIVLFIASTAATQLESQNYQTVYSNRIALFESSGKIKGLRIDSVKALADTVMFPFATIQEAKVKECFSANKASWIGEKVIIKKGGINLFFNRDGDTITLKTHTGINENWIVFQKDTFRVKAFVSEVVLRNVLGLNDSVKTISFTVINKQGNPVEHTLNKLKVKISKSLGFVEALNFYLFPDKIVSYPRDNLSIYSLVGFSNPKIGLQNLKWFEVFNFKAGDELHVLERKTGDPGQILPIREYDNRCIYKYLDRSVFADSIVYRLARKQSIKTVYNDRTVLDIFNDTLKSVVKLFPEFDKIPGEPSYKQNSAFQMYMRNDQFLMKIDPGKSGEYAVNGNCLSIITSEGCQYEKRYYNGLGGPYFYCSGYMGEMEERKLVYYKKGDITWGEKLVITDLKIVNSIDEIKVYPNPTRDVVTFQMGKETGTCLVNLYSVSGILIKSEVFEGKLCRLNLTGLKRGIYFYKITSRDTSLYKGKLVVY